MYTANRFWSDTPVGEANRDAPVSGPAEFVPLVVALGLMMLAITLKPLQSDFGTLPTLLFLGRPRCSCLCLLRAQNSGSSADSVDPSDGNRTARSKGLRSWNYSTSTISVLVLTVMALSAAPLYAALVAERASPGQDQCIDRQQAAVCCGG